jgi:ribonuclease VapC
LIVVDSSAIIAILLDEPERHLLERAISEAERAVMSVANALEVIMVAVGKAGGSGRQRAEILIRASQIEITALQPDDWQIAVDVFMRFGRGRGHPAKLNFGDCMAYALAKSLDAPLLYKGEDFALTDIRSALA